MNAMSIPLFVFAFSMCITPGPNNIMLTASGANFGFRRTIPHILGIEFGLIGLIFIGATGLGAVFQSIPAVQWTLKGLGATYLLYLAFKIGTAKPSDRKNGSNEKSRPLSFIQAAAFQFLNPKALMMAVTAVSTFTHTGEGYNISALAIMVTFAIVCLPSISMWAGFGTVIGRFLEKDIVFRILNISLGVLTALSVVMVV